MKEYEVCVKSYLFNNSDYCEYDVYYLLTESFEEAKKIANEYIANWNKESKNGVVYEVYNILHK